MNFDFHNLTFESSHTALSREAAGLRTPAASHRPLPTLGYFRWVTFKLFVPYSFTIRSLFVIIRSLCKRSHPRAMFRFLGAILGSLGSILGSSWRVLGASWAPFTGLKIVRGRSWARLTVKSVLHPILRRHLGRFWTHLGCQKGAKTEPKPTKNRSKNRLKKRSCF